MFNPADENPNEQTVPWLPTPSIYEYISQNLEPETGRLRDDAARLPDEERRYPNSHLRWAPGALDGVIGHHTSIDTGKEKHLPILAHLINITEYNSLEDKIALYHLLVEDDVLDYVDQVIAELVQTEFTDIVHLHDFVQFLAKDTPDRGPVKFAIALLGLIGTADDVEAISILGRHDEFTLYSSVALTNILTTPDVELWQLAQMVDGWGKIHLVEQLSTTQSPEIKAWLLREGYKNNVMIEYLALPCAVGGDLRGELAVHASEIDEEVIDAAGDLIQALIYGGPAEGIEAYKEAGIVIPRYLEILTTRATTLTHFVTVNTIALYLTNADNSFPNKHGWTTMAHTLSTEYANQILSHPQWIPKIQQGLQSTDDHTFYIADLAANTLGIDTWDVHWQRLNTTPVDSLCWFNVLKLTSEHNIDRVLHFGHLMLPLEDIATGAGNEMGFGPQYEVHRCVEYILQTLNDYPTRGWPFIAAALQSPLTHNRNLALQTLSTWGRENWTAEIHHALTNAASVEPEDKVKARMMRVLNGEDLD